MIAVLGNGHLGNYIVNNVGAARMFSQKIEQVKHSELEGYDVVVNTAAKTDLAWCEANQAETKCINVDAALELRHMAIKAGARFIQLSSGCIWSGPFNVGGSPFGPEDPPSPASYYAESKADCDREMKKEHMSRTAILRLRMPYSSVHSHRNLLDKLSRYDALIHDPNTITSADTLVATVDRLVNEPACPLWGRVSLVYDWGVTSPYEIGMMLYHSGVRSSPPKTLEKLELDRWHRPRRVSTVMFDEMFESYINPPSVERELKRVIALYAGTNGARSGVRG